MYNVENRGDGCTMLRIEEMDVQCLERTRRMYNVENRGDGGTMLRIEEMDVQC